MGDVFYNHILSEDARNKVNIVAKATPNARLTAIGIRNFSCRLL